MFRISPHFIKYLQRVEKGDKVIWDAGMKWLTCFSDKYSHDHTRTIGVRWNPMFEIICEFDNHGYWNHQHPIGIRFQCVHAQLITSNALLETQCLEDGSLPAIALYRDALSHLKKSPDFSKEKRLECAITGGFLLRERILIPPNEIEKILAGVIRQ